MLSIPERKGIEEYSLRCVVVLEGPSAPAIDRLVNFTGGSEQVSRPAVDSLYISEVECRRIRDSAAEPRLAAVSGSEEGPLVAAGPGDSGADSADPTKLRRGAAGLILELGMHLGAGEKNGESGRGE